MARVIGGASGGRRLAAPSGRGTRPTSDRVREALFSSLESLCGGLAGRAFLDLYAGSGAVGLEAASRGAAPVTLVEREPAAVQVIRANLAALGIGGVEIAAMSVARFLEGEPRPFDAVFLDPPYADPVHASLVTIATAGWLSSGAVVCVERATRGEPVGWPPGLEAIRSRRYGDTTLWYGRAS